MEPCYSRREEEGEAKMSLLGILPYTRSILEAVIKPGDTVMDATMGNGLDSLFLAKLVGSTGKVFAYDIQKEALLKTKQRLLEAGCLEQVELLLKGHQHVTDELATLEAPIAAAMFNLGYRPGGDTSIVTKPDTTIEAVRAIASSLKKGGLITLVIYSGHEEGQLEKDQLLAELTSWNQREFDVLQYRFINQINNPPFLVAIQKR